MSHVVARTRRVRIGSGVLVAPYRDPVLTAKMFSSLDQLSGGRIDMGVGTGWASAEFAALGKAEIFEDRGA
jgi:alkanesulfonate monooxygenase SsuD/methylene tetrahydromethanopterin reductase-like flavin-dependent oxidoreductase (luciferase family)